ncbi:amino acid adenylation domain-containing protein [Amycolatopsis sp. NPDC051758]|uniref:amino acid adenylation domain-containing protein n=1 Tax=Amycolatopsis sp. NPDC051758 TaxID=3363935 RepID=UPI0037BD5FA1
MSTALYRLPAGLADETLRARAADHDASLWFQPVPLASADADLWRDRELGRATAGGARFVVLSYVDGVRELVVTTPVPEPEPLAPLPETAADRDPLTHLTGTSEPSTVDLGPADPADVLAALGLVFSRYTRSATLAFGVPGGATLVTVDEDQPVGVFRKQVATAPAGATRDVPTVGVVADEQREPQPIRVVSCTPYPLTVHVTGGNATAWFAGNAVAPWAAAQLGHHLTAVLAELRTGNPDRPLADITLDAGPEPQPATAGNPRTITAVFAEQAARRGDAPAVSGEDGRLGYAELAERAERFAAGLQDRGIRPGDRVGIVHERGAGLVALLLGVLRAGAVYVPLDPAYPDQRLAYIADDAGLALVVTDETAAGRLPGVPAVTSADLPADGEVPAELAGPDDPAYVIYTSGSTGRPKGVVVPHRNVVDLVAGTTGDFGLGDTDVWTWFHSVAFDFSVWEIWGPLLTGGRVVVVPEWTRREPDEFAALLRDERVTVLNQTPSSFAQVTETQLRRFDDLPLRLVVFGGEPLDAFALLPWFDRYPETRCRLVNMFGITETTVHVTAQTVTRADALAGSRSVGRAIPGWEIHVVDARRRRLPPGVPGEIAVGGAGLAHGYLGRPELTADRFVTDPGTGRRRYLSGDLGRLRPDGRLEHLGRLDSQVKLRGYRIELDEIRKVLLAEPDVVAAAVVLAAPGTAEARLDAYVVQADGTPGSALAGLRTRAAALLPGYMVPSTFTAVTALPLTVNGKLDEAALPEPVLGGAPAAAVVEATGDADVVLGAWRSVLGAAIGPDDHFFDSGGNSLLAAKTLAALRDAGLTVGIRDLYGHPTPRLLAAHLAGPPAQKEAQP